MNLEFIVGRPVLNSVSMHLHVEFLFKYASCARTSLEKNGRNGPQYVLYVQILNVSMIWQDFSFVT